jgi:hypothetical protein
MAGCRTHGVCIPIGACHPIGGPSFETELAQGRLVRHVEAQSISHGARAAPRPQGASPGRTQGRSTGAVRHGGGRGWTIPVQAEDKREPGAVPFEYSRFGVR